MGAYKKDTSDLPIEPENVVSRCQKGGSNRTDLGKHKGPAVKGRVGEREKCSTGKRSRGTREKCRQTDGVQTEELERRQNVQVFRIRVSRTRTRRKVLAADERRFPLDR